MPYKDGDQKLLGKKGEMKKIVSKYWPNKCEFIFELGYKKTVFSGVYDLDKAKNILNWEPKYNYDEWFNDCQKKDLNFEEEKKQYQQKKSILNKILKILKNSAVIYYKTQILNFWIVFLLFFYIYFNSFV